MKTFLNRALLQNLWRGYPILALALVALLTTGCQTSAHRTSKEAPDVFHYTGDMPVLIFIPLYASDEGDQRGYAARIASPPRTFTTNRIDISVGGEVRSPGHVSLRAGGTVLEAINSVGGFAPYAFTKRLRLYRKSGQYVNLYRHTQHQTGERFRLIWYNTCGEPSAGIPASDFVLAEGDGIHVERAVLFQ